MKKYLAFLTALLMVPLMGCGTSDQSDNGDLQEEPPVAEKPVIYLYPETPIDVSVTLDFDGELLVTYPTYQEGWEVTAYPDGTLLQHGQSYNYLFWDGISNATYDMGEGFVVKGEDTEKFLVEKLSYLGLTPTEYNEFIVYWLPRMIDNPYNLITFQEESYTDHATLEITPTPDSIQRVFMVFQPLEEEITLPQQQLTPFVREGFTVIEWGGTELDEMGT